MSQSSSAKKLTTEEIKQLLMKHKSQTQLKAQRGVEPAAHVDRTTERHSSAPKSFSVREPEHLTKAGNPDLRYAENQGLSREEAELIGAKIKLKAYGIKVEE